MVIYLCCVRIGGEHLGRVAGDDGGTATTTVTFTTSGTRTAPAGVTSITVDVWGGGGAGGGVNERRTLKELVALVGNTPEVS